ncbi:MAG: lytic murein transglycosylase B [Betaproteobacteria bacterium]|nr:lytic murein transglycosylase B [Betaproteobacteria bacterium]
MSVQSRNLPKHTWAFLIGFSALLTGCGGAAAAPAALNPEIESFMEQLVTDHDFDRRQLRRWFSLATVQSEVLEAMARPSTARPWYEYRMNQVTEARILGGLEYWQRHADTLARASTEYGVPEEIIVATIGIETFYGRSIGNNNVFNALFTLAFAYPPRAHLFRSELEQFLLLARELRMNPLRFKGSYAGALGVPQFLPSSYRRHAIDFDNDGRRDLWGHSDAIGSIANYYKSYGWQPSESVIVAVEQENAAPSNEFRLLLEHGLKPHTTVAAIRRTGVSPAEFVPDDAPASVFAAETDAGPRYWIAFNNFYVITRYNRSVNYALAVHELAQELRRARHAGRF